MKAIQKDGRIIRGIPSFWIRPNGEHDHAYDKRDESVHLADGWKNIVTPAITENQRLGDFFFDEENDVWTNQVIDLTPEEIEQRENNRLLSQVESKREEIEREKLRSETIAFFNEASEEDALQNKEVFPFWKNDLAFVEEGQRYLTIENLELVLWQVVQSHAPMDFQFRPNELPALWRRVALPDEILDWVQPLGSFDAYQTGDRARHVGFIWESGIDNNVWEPGVFGWIQIEPA